MKVMIVYMNVPHRNVYLGGEAFLRPKHPDHKRTRTARLKTRSVRKARALKARRITWTPYAPTIERSYNEVRYGY